MDAQGVVGHFEVFGKEGAMDEHSLLFEKDFKYLRLTQFDTEQASVGTLDRVDVELEAVNFRCCRSPGLLVQWAEGC